MSYCINPLCNERSNPDDAEQCSACGTSLLINNRIRLLRPLRDDSYSYTDIFEIEDLGTKWHPVREIRLMKVLKWASEPKRVELIQREALALQVIRHPGVPTSTIDDYFTFYPNQSSIELHCLVMQKMSGENLEIWINNYGKISQSLAIDWLKQLVKILDTVHRSTFFHRDIKPSNIIVQEHGQLALIDFGGTRQITDTYLAKISVNGGTSTGLGSESRYQTTRLGTPLYSPLEQINGQAIPQSDFYALGRTFVRLITGEELIKLKTDPDTGNLIWRHKAPQIDKPLADLLDDLMAPFPAKRPSNCQVILQRLERLPLQSKINRIIKAKPFQISAVVLSILSIFGIYRASLPWVANYFLSEGKKSVILNPRPSISWHSVSRASSYVVKLEGKGVKWTRETRDTKLAYPKQSEALRFGSTYKLTVLAMSGDFARSASSYALNMLPNSIAQQITSIVKQIQKLNLSPDEEARDLDTIYMSQKLITEAINVLLARINAGTTNPTLHRLLGDRYLEAGFPVNAQQAYTQASILAQSADNAAELALAEVGLQRSKLAQQP
jgi:serine/threonine protein kinase